MKCPKCGRQNLDDARFCNSCGRELAQVATTTKRAKVQVGKAAIASFTCSLVAPVCFVPGLIAITDPGVLSPKSDLENDNIFTCWNQDDRIRGAEPGLRIEPAEPAEATDSMLVNDPVPSR